MFYYRDGRPLTNSEITGMCIGLLMAGQHTSSSTSSWLGFYLAQNPDMQVNHNNYKDIGYIVELYKTIYLYRYIYLCT